MMSGGIGKETCVIGSGMVGLVTTKNLLEEGFDVTTFERNDYVGGLWHFTKNTEQVSVLEVTTANISKQSSCFTDFPYGEHVSLHPTAKEQQTYFEAYASHFDLYSHIRLSTAVTKIERDEASRKWTVYYKSTSSPESPVQSKSFDRVAIASGMANKPTMPHFKGIGRFQGTLVHSSQFKDARPYAGKTVLVCGLGATAADTITFLKAVGAKKIYVSHRTSIRLLPKKMDGKAMDHIRTRRMMTILDFVRTISPTLADVMGSKFMASMQNKLFPQLIGHPAFTPPRVLPPFSSTVPVISSDLAQNFIDGAVESVFAIDHISGPNSVVLTDDKTLENIDAIICCTGYIFDISSLLPADCDPCNPDDAPDHFEAVQATKHHSTQHPVPRLYRQMFSLKYPDSLVFLGHAIMPRPPFALYDTISMALAQLWGGKYPFPSKAIMEANVEQHYRRVIGQLQKGSVAHTGATLDGEYGQWIDAVAGTGCNERLGSWRLEAWKMWWYDNAWYKVLMDGVDSPHIARLFATSRGRKPWPGAKKAIEKANAEVRELGEAWKREQAKQGGKLE